MLDKMPKTTSENVSQQQTWLDINSISRQWKLYVVHLHVPVCCVVVCQHRSVPL